MYIKRIVIGILVQIFMSSSIAGGIDSANLSVKWLPGEFDITEYIRIYAETGNREAFSAAHYLIEKLQPATGQRWRPIQSSADKPISYGILMTSRGVKPELSDNGYQLHVRSRSVVIRAKTQQGMINGADHFIKLLPEQINKVEMTNNVRWNAPACDVVKVN